MLNYNLYMEQISLFCTIIINHIYYWLNEYLSNPFKNKFQNMNQGEELKLRIAIIWKPLNSLQFPLILVIQMDIENDSKWVKLFDPDHIIFKSFIIMTVWKLNQLKRDVWIVFQFVKLCSEILQEIGQLALYFVSTLC
jgi:hypothetical protein